jgi:formylglycine-generating enzyme required for sulfatase activity
VVLSSKQMPVPDACGHGVAVKDFILPPIVESYYRKSGKSAGKSKHEPTKKEPQRATLRHGPRRTERQVVSEDSSHIFICFSSKDDAVARAVVQFLEAQGLKCWISLRDILPGENYQESIVLALEQAKIIVFLFSKSSNASAEIKKELSLAERLKKPVFPLRLSPIMPRGALRYELATRQWIDIFPDRQQALRKLVETIRNIPHDPAATEDDAVRASPMATIQSSTVDNAAAPGEPAAADERARAERRPVIMPGSQEFEAIRVLLARHIGPIAKVLVQKAAVEACAPDDLCERLAAYVIAPSDRAAFLEAAVRVGRAEQSPLLPRAEDLLFEPTVSRGRWSWIGAMAASLTIICVGAYYILPVLWPGPASTIEATCAMCPEMVMAPAGSFTMGSPASEPERNEHTDGQKQVGVTIARPFAVGKFAVTFDEWDASVADGGCKGYRPDDQGWGRGRRPVINVSWDDAEIYIDWLNAKTDKTYRLLSEAEREYVTRAGTTTPFWWGTAITSKQANYDGEELYRGGGNKGEFRRQTVPVDSFEANPWGLFNVHANVAEWTEDCWNDSHQGNPGNGSARKTGDCDTRVVRGGSWISLPQRLRAASRGRVSTDYRSGSYGFRLARTSNP